MMDLSPSQRLALVQHVNDLVQADFETLVFSLKAPRHVIPYSSSPQGERSSALLEWVEGATGCGMEVFMDVLHNIAPLPSELKEFISSSESGPRPNAASILKMVGKKQADWSPRQAAILRQVSADVEQRLADGLNNDRLIVVGMTETLVAVARKPLAAPRTLTTETQVTTTIDPDLPILQVFCRKDIAGKLLILGAPGMGKTTLLLTLAKALATAAQNTPGTVLPVLFELSAWTDDRQSIEEWLVAQLKELYNLSPEEGKAWLDNQVLLPMLDGLDELGPRQVKCMDKINEFAQSYPHLVVCCRTEEYRYLSEGKTLSALRGAVCLDPLTDEQIEAYLETVQVGDLWTAVKSSPDMQHMLEPDAEGKPGILRVPLLLSMAAVAYEGEPFGDRTALYRAYVEQRLAQDTRRVERQQGQHLGYKEWAYEPWQQEPSRQKTTKTLAWVARQLIQRNQVELLIERIQPYWLEDRASKWVYRLTSELVFALILGLILALSFDLSFDLSFPLILGLILAMHLSLPLMMHGRLGVALRSKAIGQLIWVLRSRLGKIGTVEAFKISFSPEVQRKILNNLREWLISGLFFGLISGLFLWQRVGLSFGLSLGLIGGLSFGLIGGLIGGLKQELQLRSRPNQGVHNSFQSLIWTTLFTYPLGILLTFGITELSTIGVQDIPDQEREGSIFQTLLSTLPSFLIPGIFCALFFGFLVGGGLPVVQHYWLRLVLWQRGIAPWDLPQFLNYCVERRLLQRVGGRYRFLHRELLDYFAGLDI